MRSLQFMPEHQELFIVTPTSQTIILHEYDANGALAPPSGGLLNPPALIKPRICAMCRQLQLPAVFKRSCAQLELPCFMATCAASVLPPVFHGTCRRCGPPVLQGSRSLWSSMSWCRGARSATPCTCASEVLNYITEELCQ